MDAAGKLLTLGAAMLLSIIFIPVYILVGNIWTSLIITLISFFPAVFVLFGVVFKLSTQEKNESLKQATCSYSIRQQQINKILYVVHAHADELASRRRQLVTVDAYGEENPNKWKKEIAYFTNKYIGALPGGECELDGNELYRLIDNHVVAKQKELAKVSSYDPTITALEYEQYCANLLIGLGWSAEVTLASGDQGVDISAIKNNFKVAIQCKKYSTPVGNKAVQEAHAGKGFISADLAAVITNSSFTRSAMELANALDVVLLHHTEVRKLNSYCGNGA